MNIQTSPPAPVSAIGLIAAERLRQIEIEDWSAEHDAEHTDESLAWAAVHYAQPKQTYHFVIGGDGYMEAFEAWPGSWDDGWDKKDQHDRIRQLTIAGALTAAEIARLQALNGQAPDDTLADLHMIAARQELFDACEKALELLEPFDDPGLSLGLGSEALTPLRKAIAKARGETC